MYPMQDFMQRYTEARMWNVGAQSIALLTKNVSWIYQLIYLCMYLFLAYDYVSYINFFRFYMLSRSV